MKIIQTFAQFEDGNQYTNGKLLGTEIYLNFYTFLLSYLTLKKYYKEVTMYCNQRAYDTFIKYIPYDEVVIKENRYTQENWSNYKLDVLDTINESFIHVDCDVFLFGDLFKPYIENQNTYDIIVQYVDKDNINFPKDYYQNFSPVCDVKLYNPKVVGDDLIGNNFSCGVMGMSENVRKIYIEDTKKILNKLETNILTGDRVFKNYFIEEATLYFTATRNSFKWYELFKPIKHSISSEKWRIMGDLTRRTTYNYTHLWWNKKFTGKNIELIKNVIKTDFPDDYHLVDIYEKSISDIEIFAFSPFVKNVIKFKR